MKTLACAVAVLLLASAAQAGVAFPCAGGRIELRAGSSVDVGTTGSYHHTDLGAGASFDFTILHRCTDSNAACSSDDDCGNHQCVATCDCAADPTCEIRGPVQQRRCLTTLTKCETRADCPSLVPCVAMFGPPLPLSAAGTPLCVQQNFDGPLSGTLNVSTGETHLSASLHWRVSLGDLLERPCSRCGAPGDSPEVGDVFTCEGGPSQGQSCHVDAVTAEFGGTSFDCPSSPAANVTGAGVAVPLGDLTTETTTRTAALPCGDVAVPNPLESPARCTDRTGAADPLCTSNADCRRCSGDSSIACAGDDDCTGHGSCAEAPDQPISCGYWCHCGFCDGDATRPCFSANDCAGGQDCEVGKGFGSQPNAPQVLPNDCASDQFRCGETAEGSCASSTVGSCSQQPWRPCAHDTLCEANDAGVCVLAPRPCFESRIRRSGEPSPLAQDDTAAPSLAAISCMPATSSQVINGTGGLTGPLALSLDTSMKICRCQAPDNDCDDVCNYAPVCGNEVVDPGEECDGGACCQSDCTYGTSCDDGDPCTSDDSCSNGICSGVKQGCGDGTLQEQCEDCDDGNTADGDGCSQECVKQQICGDANDDGSILATDAVRILQRAVGLDVDCAHSACDADGSGRIDTSDALRVLRKSVGLEVTLGCRY